MRAILAIMLVLVACAPARPPAYPIATDQMSASHHRHTPQTAPPIRPERLGKPAAEPDPPTTLHPDKPACKEPEVLGGAEVIPNMAACK